eukprot:1157247-Pelagomonas_calceolata.AAC.10
MQDDVHAHGASLLHVDADWPVPACKAAACTARAVQAGHKVLCTHARKKGGNGVEGCICTCAGEAELISPPRFFNCLWINCLFLLPLVINCYLEWEKDGMGMKAIPTSCSAPIVTDNRQHPYFRQQTAILTLNSRHYPLIAASL